MARSNPPMASSFVAELARRLQGQSPALALPLTWIEQRLSRVGLTIEQLVQSEDQQQAADQVSISNSIGSLRLLGAMDWREFVETMSVVEQTLREDPGGVYARMDFATRDRYRHVGREDRQAQRAVRGRGGARRRSQLAHEARGAVRTGDEPRAAHVGFYLIDKGAAAARSGPRTCALRHRALRALAAPPLPFYLGAIALITALLTAGPARAGASRWRRRGTGCSRSALLLSLLATSQLAVALVNWLATLLVRAAPLPRMDFSEGIPPESRTLVVVPTHARAARRTSRIWSRRWKCASSPTATSTCTSAC